MNPKTDWVTTPAKKSFPRFPEMDEWQGLVNAFRAERGG